MTDRSGEDRLLFDELVLRSGWTRPPIEVGRQAARAAEREITAPVLWSDPAGSIELLALSRGLLCLEFWGVRVAVVDPEARWLLILPGAVDRLGTATLSHVLRDQVLPRLAAYTHGLVLHAAALGDATGGMLLVGKSGRGKSTLSAALALDHHTLLGDDAVVLAADGEYIRASALYPSLRLLPDSVDALFPEGVESLPTADYGDKQRLDRVAAADKAVCTVSMIVFLGEDTGEQAVALRPLKRPQVCMMLIANSFALDPSDPDQARRRFGSAGTIAARVPAFELSYPRDYRRLPEVRASLRQALKSLAGPRQVPVAR